MRCPKCATDNRDTAKFCDKCGARLSPKCSSCGAENRPDARFCDSCGAAFGTPSRAVPEKSTDPPIRIAETPSSEGLEGERKTVTALFADIKGSTELMEDLDPEEARAIIDPALKVMIDAVQRYDGYVVQSTGDGIFALFGAPVAHEDHPQRALYAALRMQEELRRYSAKLVADGGNPLQSRVGINTGEVVVRAISTGGGHEEYTPIGHTTNLASRMQAVAPVGSIAVTEPTRKLCEGYFTLRPLGPTRVKGLNEAINVYEVTGLGPLRTRFQRAAGRGLTRFVGRAREMEALRHAAEQAQSGHGQIVAVMAEAGVGKSRLLFEFKATSRSDWMVLETFSVSHGKASAYLPVIDLLHNYFRLTSQDDARTRREKVNGKILTLDRSLEDALPYLFRLLGLVDGDDPFAAMDAQVRRRRTLDAIKRILLRESLNQPLMVIFEDLHWIDEQTQEFLNLLADSIGTAKILLLVNYRPEYSHQWGSKTYYTQLRLDPLARESAEEMLATLLGDGAELAPLKHVIIEKTEGTPFFIEETVQALLEEGALVRNGTVKLVEPLAELRIPPTVQAILAARIDRLPSDAKELLHTLAVIGREFPLSLIHAVVAKSDDELNRVLNNLQLGEFIYEQPAVGDTVYIFKHALTQEVAYGSVLARRRGAIHERVGAAIEALYDGRCEEHLDELARHYRRSSNVAKAVDYLLRAGQRSAQRFAHAEAMDHLNAGLDALANLPKGTERDRKEVAILAAVGTSVSVSGGYGSAEATRALERAHALCDPDKGQSELFEILIGLVLNYLPTNLSRSRDAATQLVEISERSGDSGRISCAFSLLGNVLLWLGEFEHSLDAFARSIAVPEVSGHPNFLFGDSKTISFGLGGWALWFMGYPARALRRGREAVERARGLRNPLALGWGLCDLAEIHHLRREPVKARDIAEEAVALAEAHGFSFQSAFAAAILGWARVELDDPRGIDDLERSISTYSSIGSAPTNLVLATAADAYARTGQKRQAIAVLQSPIRGNDEMYEAELRRLKGVLRFQPDGEDPSKCGFWFGAAIEAASATGAKSWELRAITSFTRLLANQGKREEARAMLAEIYNWFTEGFDTADLIDAKALLDELSS
jgi:class 3 adenylate cyclase/tetratricopeptide (TPR) repeat protein